MRRCLKSEHESKNKNHSCVEPTNTIDVYISSQSETVQPFLNQVRDTIRAVLPED